MTERQDPFFIVHKHRSGSTYLADLLTMHPDIAVAPESLFIPKLWKWSRNGKKRITTKDRLAEVLHLVYSEPKFVSWEIPNEALFSKLLPGLPYAVDEICRQVLLAYCRMKYPGRQVWGMKKGGWYARNISLLRTNFPQAQFITIVRDGRAVYASSKRATHSETGLPFETDPILSALTWKRIVSDFDELKAKPFVLEIRYERLISDPGDTLRKLLRFLGVDAGQSVIEAMLKPHRSSYVHDRDSHLHPNVGKLPQLSRIDAWRHELSAADIKKFERVAGSVLVDRGYPLVNLRTRSDDLYAMWAETRILLQGLKKRFGSYWEKSVGKLKLYDVEF